jgi:hypothetical protein
MLTGSRTIGTGDDAHFRASRRWIVSIIGATFLFQAVQIVLA